MTVTEIRKAIPHRRDRQYERDVFERLVKSSFDWRRGHKVLINNHLLLGCAVDRLEISGTHIALGFRKMDNFLRDCGARQTAMVWHAVSLYRLLVERKFRAEEIDELNTRIMGLKSIMDLNAHLRSVQTKEECKRLIEAHFSSSKRRLLNVRIKRKYPYGAHLVEFRTVDLLQSVENYLQSISPLQPNGAEIIKALAVKALVEKPTDKKVVSWCREFGIPPIFSALFLGLFQGQTQTHFLSFDKLMKDWNGTEAPSFRKGHGRIRKEGRSMLERTMEFFGADQCEE